MTNKNEDYPHIDAMLDAVMINYSRDKVVELLEKLTIVLGSVGMSLDVLEDEENELVDKLQLKKVVLIALGKAGELMADIIQENEVNESRKEN